MWTDQRRVHGRPYSSSARLRGAGLQGIQVSLGVQPVLPLLVEYAQQALTHRVAARPRPDGPLDRFGVAVQRRVGQALDDLAHGGHPVAAQIEHRVERRTCGAVAGHPRRVGHLVPRQVQGVPRRRVAEDRPPDPGVGGEHQVAQGLDERPLAVDRLVQQLRSQAAGPLNGLGPQPLEDVPRLAEPGRVRRAHLGPAGITPVELGVDQGPDVNSVDPQVLDLAVNVDVDQLDAPHHDPAQVDAAEPRAGEVNALEHRASQIGTNEVSHETTLTSGANDPPAWTTEANHAVGGMSGWVSGAPRGTVTRWTIMCAWARPT